MGSGSQSRDVHGSIFCDPPRPDPTHQISDPIRPTRRSQAKIVTLLGPTSSWWRQKLNFSKYSI